MIYEKGIKAGAMAGKIMGAGGGGHFLFICSPGKQKNLIERMKGVGVTWVDFSICWNGLEVRDITGK